MEHWLQLLLEVGLPLGLEKVGLEVFLLLLEGFRIDLVFHLRLSKVLILIKLAHVLIELRMHLNNLLILPLFPLVWDSQSWNNWRHLPLFIRLYPLLLLLSHWLQTLRTVPQPNIILFVISIYLSVETVNFIKQRSISNEIWLLLLMGLHTVLG